MRKSYDRCRSMIVGSFTCKYCHRPVAKEEIQESFDNIVLAIPNVSHSDYVAVCSQDECQFYRAIEEGQGVRTRLKRLKNEQ